MKQKFTSTRHASDGDVPGAAHVAPHTGQRYRFSRLSPPMVVRDMTLDLHDPAPGARVPDFDLSLVGGGRFRSRELPQTGPALLIFGSSTCPMTDSAAPGLRDLHRRFGTHVRFVMVNVREAHPGQLLPQPVTPAEKVGHADHLKALHHFDFDVAVDDLDGSEAFESVVSGRPLRHTRSGGVAWAMLCMLNNISRHFR